MLRILALAILASATNLVDAQTGNFKLAAPDNWGGETIQLPPGFAKDMTFKGAEHIRFAPGMMQANSDTFFCYAFVFQLDPTPALTPELIKQETLKYYRGLSKAVLNGKLPGLDPTKFTLKLKTIKQSDAAKRFPDATIHYTGVLDWVEPFATKESQTLNLEMQTWKTDQHNYLFVCVSPQSRDANIWKQLRKIRDDYILK